MSQTNPNHSQNSNAQEDAIPSRRGFLKTAGTALLAAGTAGAIPATTQLAPPDKQPPDIQVPGARRKVKWAIVGLGELALGEVLPASRDCELTKVAALVSGH